MKKFILCLLLTIASLSTTFGHKCIQGLLNHTATYTSETVDLTERSTNREFNIRVFYTLHATHHRHANTLTQRIIPAAVEFWRKYLSLKHPVKDRIRIRPSCKNGQYYPGKDPQTGKPEQRCAVGCTTSCIDVEIPAELLDFCLMGDQYGGRRFTGKQGAGANGDFVIIVDATQGPHCRSSPSTLAYAATCSRSLTSDIPRSGAINFCEVSFTKLPAGLEDVISTAQHEIGHALGFSWESFQMFRDENGNKYSAVKEVTVSTKTVNGVITEKIKALTAPKLVEKARKYFDCIRIDYVPLENEGGPGTEKSHFEQRVLGNGLMTGVTFTTAKVSPLDLGFFEATGWYRVEYPPQYDLRWGNGYGCEFFFGGCKSLVNKPKKQYDSNPFCSQNLGKECLPYENGVGLCYVGNFRSTGEMKSYIPRDRSGAYVLSKSQTTDGCPIYMPLSSSQLKLTAYCWDINNKGKGGSNRMEIKSYYGNDSACIEAPLGKPWTVTEGRTSSRSTTESNASCRKYRCVGREMEVRLGNKWVKCSGKDNKNVDFEVQMQGKTVKGAIVCPPKNLYCKN